MLFDALQQLKQALRGAADQADRFKARPKITLQISLTSSDADEAAAILSNRRNQTVDALQRKLGLR